MGTGKISEDVVWNCRKTQEALVFYNAVHIAKANFEMATAPHIAEIKYIRDKVNIF